MNFLIQQEVRNSYEDLNGLNIPSNPCFLYKVQEKLKPNFQTLTERVLGLQTQYSKSFSTKMRLKGLVIF